MAVYYRFKSAKNFESMSIEGNFITLGDLKYKIFHSKQYGRGNDYDLLVINAQTNEEYLDEAILIPKYSSVLIRRLAGPLTTTNDKEQVVENRHESDSKTNFLGAGHSVTNHVDVLDENEFGDDVYAVPEVEPVISTNPVNPPRKADEDKKTQHKQITVEAAKKKKKKRVKLPTNVADMQWATPQEFGSPFPYKPYWNWNGMHPGMVSYGGFIPPFMGYGPRPLSVPPGMMPPLIPPHSRDEEYPREVINTGNHVPSTNLKSVRNFVVHVLFVYTFHYKRHFHYIGQTFGQQCVKNNLPLFSFLDLFVFGASIDKLFQSLRGNIIFFYLYFVFEKC